MPVEAWDENAPAGGSWAYEGDDAIRQLKRALTERLDDVIKNWPDGTLTLDSTKLDPPITAAASIGRGTFAAMPNPATFDFYSAEDTDQFFVKEGTVYREIAAAGTAASNISFAQLRKKTLTSTDDWLMGTGANGLSMPLFSIPNANVDDYIVLGVKVRGKLDAEPDFEQYWGWRGSPQATSDAGTHITGATAGLTKFNVDAITSGQSGTTAQWQVALSGYAHADDSPPITVNVEAVLYLLCLNTAAPADA